MSHQILLSDEAYQVIAMLADEQGKTPEEVIEIWVVAQTRNPQIEPHFQQFDEFFAELGMSDSEIQRSLNNANI